MSDAKTQTINPPDLDDVLEELKFEIFANFNCIQIGRIEKYDKSTQIAEIQIQVKRRVGSRTINYPLLVDCPVVILQGGESYIEFPIKKDDYCLIFFNDRDIDNWFSTGNVKEPNTTRKHDLSDGIALVGINPETSPLGLDGSKVVLNCENVDFEINANNVKILAGTESFVKGDTTKTNFDTLLNLIKTHTHTVSGTDSGGDTFSTTSGPPLNAGSMTNHIDLSTKIKGE
jgi:hypothetical protein